MKDKKPQLTVYKNAVSSKTKNREFTIIQGTKNPNHATLEFTRKVPKSCRHLPASAETWSDNKTRTVSLMIDNERIDEIIDVLMLYKERIVNGITKETIIMTFEHTTKDEEKQES